MSFISWLFGLDKPTKTVTRKLSLNIQYESRVRSNVDEEDPILTATGTRVKPLIVFGKYKIGKSWFLSLLFKSLGLDYTKIDFGHDKQTKGLQYYDGTITKKEIESIYGFFDTEVSYQPGSTVEDNIALFSAVTSIPGVIIFFVRSFDTNDEIFLIQLCQMVPVSQGNHIIVVHNCSNANPQSLNGIKRNLIANESSVVPIYNSGNFELLSGINGHVVKHLFLVQHTTVANMEYNQSVAREVISYLNLVTSRNFDDIELVIQAKVNRMNLSLYRFYLNYQLVGLEFPSQVSIYYRILDNSEIRETDLISKNPLIDDNIFASDISNMALCTGEPTDRFRVLEIFGSIKYEKTILKIGGALHKSDPHFNILSVVNGVEVGGEPNPQDSHLYTPDVIYHVVGRTMKNNCLFIFVKLIGISMITADFLTDDLNFNTMIDKPIDKQLDMSLTKLEAVYSPYLNPLQGEVIDKISDNMRSTRSNIAYSDIKSIDDKFETSIIRSDDFEISSNSLLKEAMEIQFTQAITAKNLYLPFSADYPGATVLLPPTTDAEDDYLQKFDHIKDWLSSQYKAKAKCQLLYHPINTQPYCYIFTTGDEVVVKDLADLINGDLSKQINFPFTIIVDSLGNYSLGYNSEFKNYNNINNYNLTSLETLIREFGETGLITNFRNRFLSDNDIYVMYGHYYNYDTCKWEDRLAIWVCYVDPIRRYFKTSLDEYRPESFSNLPIHYFSANYVANSIEDTDIKTMHSWNDFDVNKQLLVGMVFRVVLGLEKKSGTIGPSVKSIYPSNKIPDNWFFTNAHIFQCDSTGQYFQGSTLVDSSGTQPIGRLISLYETVDWAIIEIYHTRYSSNVKISIDGDQLPIKGSIDFDNPDKVDFDIACNWPKVFKSGSASGITKGKIFSWGHLINTKQFPSHERLDVARPDEIFIQRETLSNLSECFAIKGDSGAPLLVLKDNHVKCAGLVTANLLIYENLKLSIISPIYKYKHHVLKFVRNALLYKRIISNYDEDLQL